MKLRKFGRAKRLRRSKEGVHSLIGDFLVLAITILLLSGIFMYVMALPPPDDTTYVDFDPAIPVVVQTYSNNTCDRYINITNSGGQDLYDHATGIYIFINETMYPSGELYIHDSETPSRHGLDGRYHLELYASLRRPKCQRPHADRGQEHQLHRL